MSLNPSVTVKMRTPTKQNGNVGKGDGESLPSGASPSLTSKGEHKIGTWESKTAPGVMGINNHGNTCFMNAILQCLSNTERFVGYLITDQYAEDIKRNNKQNAKKYGTRGELTVHLATLLKSLWTCKYTPEISADFKAVVAKFGCQYRGCSQHDAQEFLMWLLDKVHEDLNIATKKKYRENKVSRILDVIVF